MKRVHDFLKKAEVYYLATVEGDQPRVRPFGTVNEFEGKLYVQTGKVKPTSKQLAANPKAEICAFSDGAWVRIACELVEDDRFEARITSLRKRNKRIPHGSCRGGIKDKKSPAVTKPQGFTYSIIDYIMSFA